MLRTKTSIELVNRQRNPKLRQSNAESFRKAHFFSSVFYNPVSILPLSSELFLLLKEWLQVMQN